MLLANVPVRIVAEMCDTSVREIEATYGAYITDHSDQITRAVVLDIETEPEMGTVVPMPLKR
jgi:hypothetical protein